MCYSPFTTRFKISLQPRFKTPLNLILKYSFNLEVKWCLNFGLNVSSNFPCLKLHSVSKFKLRMVKFHFACRCECSVYTLNPALTCIPISFFPFTLWFYMFFISMCHSPFRIWWYFPINARSVNWMFYFDFKLSF